MRGKRAVLGLLLLSASMLAVAAQAALVAIDPVKVILTGALPSKSVALRNNGAERVRFQVTAFTWQQSVSGEMQLTPTQELVFFPSLVEIGPGETRRVRVTTTTQVSSQEHSYRLFMDQLPEQGAAPSGAVRVLTRFGLPVFQLPDAPSPKPALKLELAAGKLKVSLSNNGNAHFVAQSVRIVGRAADGSSVLQQDLPAWYVLAGGQRNYEVSPASDICHQLTQVSANANTDNGTARTDLRVQAGACEQP